MLLTSSMLAEVGTRLLSRHTGTLTMDGETEKADGEVILHRTQMIEPLLLERRG